MEKGAYYLIVFLICYAVLCIVSLYWGCHIPQYPAAKTETEHRRAVRGRAYRLGLAALLAYLAVWALLAIGGVIWCDAVFGFFGGAAFALTPALTICILQDACVPDGRVWTNSAWVINLVGLSEVFLVLVHVRAADLVENGRVSGNASALIFLLLCLTMDACLFLRGKRRKSEKK